MECNGNKYPIRVVEEQVVINHFMKVDCDAEKKKKIVIAKDVVLGSLKKRITIAILIRARIMMLWVLIPSMMWWLQTLLLESLGFH